MFRNINLKQIFSQDGHAPLFIVSAILSMAFANTIIHLFFKFALINAFRVVLYPLLVTWLCFPLNLLVTKKYFGSFKNGSQQVFRVISGLSILTAIVLYIASPIKIMGNLLMLNNLSLFIYRISRLFNILGFLITTSVLILVLNIGVFNKMKSGAKWTTLLAVVFFFLYLILGLFVYRDYGIAIDEPNEHETAIVSTQFFMDLVEKDFTGKDPSIQPLSTYYDRYYGVAYQIPITLIEYNTQLKDQALWQFRHMANFLFFYCGVLAFFHLGAEFFKNPLFGLMGSLLLVLSPRIFAHSFFNSKDTIFLAAFIIAFYFSIRFWKNHTIWNGLLTGISIAFASNVRIIGFVLILISLGLFILDSIKKPSRIQGVSTSIMLVSFFLSFFFFWPASWQNPLAYLKNTIQLFSDYTVWNSRVMYMGVFMSGANPPWHYIPVWMGITIPISYILLFFIGCIVILVNILKKGFNFSWDYEHRNQVVFLSLFFSPIAIAIIMNSTLYNGWRHFQFIYAPFLLIVLLGLQFFIKAIHHRTKINALKIISIIAVFGIGLNMIITTAWMVKNHPHQNVYFNAIGSALGREKFERDYWRLSMKQGLEFLLATDHSKRINICTEQHFLRPEYAMMVSRAERDRINFIYSEDNLDACDYSINTYRRPNAITCNQPLHSIIVDNLPILTVNGCP